MTQHEQIAATLEEIRAFEHDMRIKFSEPFVELYVTLDGQDSASKWLTIQEIRALMKQWPRSLASFFGDDWKTKTFGELCDSNKVKPMLFNPRWIPFLKVDNVLWCMDFDPTAHGRSGQIIRIDPSKKLADYRVYYQEADFRTWLNKLSSFDKNIDASEQSNASLQQNNKQDAIQATTPYFQAIWQHVEQWIGPVSAVFQESRESVAHPIDFLWVEPSVRHPFHAFITCGMSQRPMTLPNDSAIGTVFSLSELVVLLPSDWEVGVEAFKDPKHYWPLHWLKTLARIPHQSNQYVGEGSLISNGENAQSIAGTQFGGILLFPPAVSLSQDFITMATEDSRFLRFNAIIPVTPMEIHFKQRYGLEVLLSRFREHHMSDIIDVNRPSTVG